MAVLGNLIEQVRGVSYKPEDLHDTLNENSITLLRANNIKDGQLNFDEVVYVDKKKVSEKQLLKAGDVLICASSGSKELVGKAAYVAKDLPMTFGAFCKVVRPKTECPQYIGHFFNSPYYRERITNSAAGANINNIRNEHIDALEIKWPIVNIQQSAVAVLDKVSKLIALRKQQLAKLDELVKARFIEMFGDVAHDNNKVCLEEISEFVTVGIANSATHAYADSGIVMLRNQNIKENYLDENDLIYITEDFADKYGSKRLAENDILVIRTGYPGVACLVPKKYEGCQTFTTLIVRLKDSSKAYANYVCHYINSSFGKDYVDQSKVGVAQQNFGAKALAKMPIVVPAPTLQDQFAAFVEQTDKSKLAVQQALDKLETLKKALMQEYFG